MSVFGRVPVQFLGPKGMRDSPEETGADWAEYGFALAHLSKGAATGKQSYSPGQGHIRMLMPKHIKNEYLSYNRRSFTIQMNPMWHQQCFYLQKPQCFQLRNYEKVKTAKDQARVAAEKETKLNNQVVGFGMC